MKCREDDSFKMYKDSARKNKELLNVKKELQMSAASRIFQKAIGLKSADFRYS